jgi:hypothetical protein
MHRHLLSNKWCQHLADLPVTCLSTLNEMHISVQLVAYLTGSHCNHGNNSHWRCRCRYDPQSSLLLQQAGQSTELCFAPVCRGSGRMRLYLYVEQAVSMVNSVRGELDVGSCIPLQRPSLNSYPSSQVHTSVTPSPSTSHSALSTTIVQRSKVSDV